MAQQAGFVTEEALVEAEERAPVIQPSLYGGFDATGGLYEPDDVARLRGFEIYDKMRRKCPRASRYITFLKDALLSGGYEIVPPNADDDVEEKIDHLSWNCEEALEGSWLDVPRNLMSAFHDGFSVNEKVIALQEGGEYAGRVYLQKFKDKNPKDFTFDQDIYGNLKPDGLVQYWRLGNDSIRHDVSRFVLYTHEGSFGNLYGRSMFEPIYEAFFARQVLARQGNVAVEKFASGILKITVPRGTQLAQKNEVLARVKRAHGACTYIIEEGETWEIQDFPVSGFDAIISWLNRYDNEMAVGLGIPILLFNIGDSGSYALSETQLKVALILYRRLQLSIDEAITENIFRPLCEMNFGPGPTPKHRLKPVDVGGIEAIFKRWEAIEKAGARPTIKAIVRDLGMREEDVEAKPEPVNPFGAGDPNGGPPKKSMERDVENDRERTDLSERAHTGPESRVNLAEVAGAHDTNASKGASALRAAIRAETARIQAAIRRESDVARGPLALRQSLVSSKRAQARSASSGRR